MPRRWLRRWLAAALASAVSASPSGAAAAPVPEGPAPPPSPPAQPPGPEASPGAQRPPGPEASPAAPRPPGPEARSEGPAPPGPEGDGRPGGLGLARQRDGSLLYIDPGKRFTAAVDADGSVRFGDRWGRDQHGGRMRGSGRALRQVGPSGIGAIGGIGITGPTEWLLALQGQERDAAAKAAFLNQTRELRIQLAVDFTLKLLETRLGELSQELLGLLSDGSRELAARRALLFQRWDECDERVAVGLPAGGELPAEAVSMIDQARLEAAERARRNIEAFIRRQLPRGTPRGYTGAELAEYNRRRVSVEAFDPYTPRRKGAP